MQGCLLRLIQKNSLALRFDKEGRSKLIFCGEELQKLTGYTTEVLQRFPNQWFSIIHPDDQASVLAQRKHLLHNPNAETQQTYRIITKDNTIKIIRERACLDAEQAQVRQVTCIITDITQDVSKEVQQHVMESEARYRSLFEHSPVGMLIIDIDETKRAIATNPKWTELMKSDMDTIMNANMLEFSPEFQPDGQRSRDKLGKLLAEYRATRQATSFEWQFKDGEEELRDMQVKLYPITVDGKGQTIMFINDITQLKEVERALRKALEKAKESDNLKSAFMANFSHEIRTPLNSVIGFSEMLNLDMDDSERQSFIQLIKDNVDFLLISIEKIIEAAKIETKQLEFEYEEFKAIELCQMIFYANKTKATEKGIQLKFKPNSVDFHASIYTDQNKLTYIINHLIDNAIKFTSSGKVEFWYTTSDEHIEFIVKDTGKGISEENQAVIFKSFRQLEDPYTKEHAGLGLGLPIVKGYIEALNGTIRLKSQLGEGTTFYVMLPRDYRAPL